MPIRAVAIDDSPAALKILKLYASKIAWLNFSFFDSPLEALDYINDNTIDAIFIDVEMQDMTGIEFIRILKNQNPTFLPKFIIVSAYAEYAVDGFELNITDYLLKPFGFDRFLQSLQKLQDCLKKVDIPQLTSSVFLRQNDKYIQVESSKVLFGESHGHYVKLHHQDGAAYLISISIQLLEDTLKPKGFIRTHKRYLVNTHFIKEVYQKHILINGSSEELPVGRSYRPALNQLVKNK